VYLRQNVYVHGAQRCDALDLQVFVAPIVLLSALSAFLGFVSTSSLVGAEGYRWNVASLLCGVTVQVWTKFRASPLLGKFDVKAESSRKAAGEYRLLATRLEARMRDHRACLQEDRTCATTRATGRGGSGGGGSGGGGSGGGGSGGGESSGGLAAEKRAFMWFFYVEVDKVQSEAKRREEQCSLYHDPKDRTTERWLKQAKLTPSRVDQPEDQGSLGRAEVEAALFLNNPSARVVRRVKVGEVRGKDQDRGLGLRGRRVGGPPGSEMTTRMRVASQDYRGDHARPAPGVKQPA
jgi:hypothetical protein